MVKLMSKGFVVFAQNTDKVDYIKQAYALALSIKYSQLNVTSVSLVTNSTVLKKYRNLFDQIIPIPWCNDSDQSVLAAEHRWKLFHVSPYDETIVLDTDMLMLEDISDWWAYCTNYDIKFCGRVRNYKLEVVHDTYHRKAFIENKLTNPYFALHYFKKSQAAYEFYKVLEFVCNNWEWCYNLFAPVEYQPWLSMDLATAIAIEISGQYDIIDHIGPLEFTHMKTPIQGWHPIPASWQDTVPWVFNNKGSLVVGNIKQDKLFHYVEKNFISNTVLSKLEELARGT
jgi:hypothetical protein